MDLVEICNAFDADKAIPADDDARYVDLSSVRGDSKIASKLVHRIKNKRKDKQSHHLLTGHTKCGKTTELNRARKLLEEDNYITVFFDVADLVSRTFEYTVVLLVMADQIAQQLAEREPPIHVNLKTREELMELLANKQVVTSNKEKRGDVTAKAEGDTGLLANLFGKIGLGLQLRGGFRNSRAITIEVERDTRAFLEAIQDFVEKARDKVLADGYEGLVVICDGCDKLELSATDENGKSRDLQVSLFVDHEPELRSIPCHVVYTVPIAVQANLGDIWEQDPGFVPAIPVRALPDVDKKYTQEGREKLKEVVERRLAEHKVTIEQLFSEVALFDKLLDASGGHISDLLLLVGDAVLEAQTDDVTQISESQVGRSLNTRQREYSKLLDTKYLAKLAEVEQYKNAPASDEYREMIFKRLVLEYVCGTVTRIDLHPMVERSEAYRRFRNPLSE